MKLCPKCKMRYTYDEQECCSYCRKQMQNRSDEDIAEETRRRRQVRNRIMGNNQRRH